MSRSYEDRNNYKHAFKNDDGLLEWKAWDKAGNEIKCYWDGNIELHIKSPVCDCGTHLKFIGGDNYDWICESCGKVYPEAFLLSLDVKSLIHEEDDVLPLSLDYGSWGHPSVQCEVGLSDDDYESYKLGLFYI